MQKKEYSVDIGGKTLSALFTDLAEQANGSVIVKYGNTSVLVTAVMSKEANPNVPFFPLTVDYEERFYASGQILGSRYVRREGKPTDEAILSGRIVDRTIRPLFAQHIRHDIQVIVTVLSIGEDDPDILGVIGASLALSVSNIPWNGPVSAVRIGGVSSKSDFIINPTYAIRDSEENTLDLLICGKENLINMIEVASTEVGEDVIAKGFEQAIIEIAKIEEWQKKIISEIGKEKYEIKAPEIPVETRALFDKTIAEKLSKYVFAGPGKSNLGVLESEWRSIFNEKFPDGNWQLASELFENAINDIIHSEAIENDKRADGRGMDELRPLYAQAGGVSPILHGTGIFYRGGTHVLSVVTLAGPEAAQLIEGMELKTNKRFIHHYNFPPFSTGETGRVGGTNRRMIGHGALAEKALLAVIPNKEKFPYTIRIVSEAFSSNGSTSMGSVCGSTLALMDAGVPIKAPVAGIASGLMMSNKNGELKYKILTDIQGPEDHHGDMDFKVAGTRNGVTAIQMDVKVNGIPVNVLCEALEKAKSARFRILDVIEKEISNPRQNISPNAPEIIMIKIKPDQIGLVIGGGGKTINQIREATGTEITIEDDGSVFVTGKNGGARRAADIVKDMTRQFVKGDRVEEAEVLKIMDFGAFVKLNSTTDGLVHVSEIGNKRIEKVTDVLKIGEKVPVIVKEIDNMGRLKLSIKDADPDFLKKKGKE